MKVKCNHRIITPEGETYIEKNDIMIVCGITTNHVFLFNEKSKQRNKKFVELDMYESHFDEIAEETNKEIEDIIGNKVHVGDTVGFVFSSSSITSELIVGEVIRINKFYNVVVEVFVRENDVEEAQYLILKDEQILLTK